MKNHCIENLLEIKSLISDLDNKDYNIKLEIISDLNIGEHISRIIKTYQSVLEAITNGAVIYDFEIREEELKHDVEKAIAAIDLLCEKLHMVENDIYMILSGDFPHEEDGLSPIEIPLYIELGFCLKHNYYRQAMVRITCHFLGLENIIPEQFEKAPSFLKNNKHINMKSSILRSHEG